MAGPTIMKLIFFYDVLYFRSESVSLIKIGKLTKHCWEFCATFWPQENNWISFRTRKTL